MNDTTRAPAAGPGWQPIDPLPPQEAEELARTARIMLPAQRAYMTAYIVSEDTADAEIRQLLGRFLQVGRLSRGGTGVLRVRSPKTDGDEAYSLYLNPARGHVTGYRGPADSWFAKAHTPLEDILRRRAENRSREEEDQQRRAVHEQQTEERRAAHERRMREQREAAAERRAAALRPTWPVMGDGQYDRSGQAAPAPSPKRPITDEARIRYVGRLPHVLFHADALNSPFFSEVPVEKRCAALVRVLDLLLRKQSKGTVVVSRDAITVTGAKVTLTLTPDCSMVRTLNPPRTASKEDAPLYQANKWPVQRVRREKKERPEPTDRPEG
ncbi:hypothetical protein ACFXB4_19525 [Streptomyces lavendulae]|uniref:hypothetical protein n=1 Tax=Streptomyces lavendulae TaxID=1914 RepID=UPI0036A30D9A